MSSRGFLLLNCVNISDRPHGVYLQTRGHSISDALLVLCFSYEKYFLMCSLTHNGKNLFKPVQSKRVGTYKSFFFHIKWDELWVILLASFRFLSSFLSPLLSVGFLFIFLTYLFLYFSSPPFFSSYFLSFPLIATLLWHMHNNNNIRCALSFLFFSSPSLSSPPSFSSPHLTFPFLSSPLLLLSFPFLSSPLFPLLPFLLITSPPSPSLSFTFLPFLFITSPPSLLSFPFVSPLLPFLITSPSLSSLLSFPFFSPLLPFLLITSPSLSSLLSFPFFSSPLLPFLLSSPSLSSHHLSFLSFPFFSPLLPFLLSSSLFSSPLLSSALLSFPLLSSPFFSYPPLSSPLLPFLPLTSSLTCPQQQHATCTILHFPLYSSPPCCSPLLLSFPSSPSVADSVLVPPRIHFPIAVAVLPLESILSLTLFAVLNQNAGGSPDSNRQRKAPELLGKVSMPLFDFRRWAERACRFDRMTHLLLLLLLLRMMWLKRAVHIVSRIKTLVFLYILVI